MKGPVAAAIVAARLLPSAVPITLLITTDEETTKQGARLIAQRSELVRKVKPHGIVVVEPTGMVPVRGHRSRIAFTCVATGVQAHSSTGRGRNANWELIPFLVEMKSVFERLRTDTSLQDADYAPAVQRLQRGDRQPWRRGERDGSEGHRADQVPLLGQGRSNAGAGGGA